MRRRTLVLFITAGLLLVGCGTDDGDVTVETEEAPEETPEAGAETDTDDGGADAGADAETTVAVASTDLGDVLVDGEGMTLYLFLPDEGGEPTCADDCLDAWPLLEGPAEAGEGADGDLLGTAEHPNGSTQVTYGGWPLYHFSNDAEPGDTNGQGLGDNWYVVSPDGEPIQER